MLCPYSRPNWASNPTEIILRSSSSTLCWFSKNKRYNRSLRVVDGVQQLFSRHSNVIDNDRGSIRTSIPGETYGKGTIGCSGSKGEGVLSVSTRVAVSRQARVRRAATDWRRAHDSISPSNIDLRIVLFCRRVKTACIKRYSPGDSKGQAGKGLVDVSLAIRSTGWDESALWPC
ncbi:hypothetical protein BDP81DRAFT_433992 [Colletotrichum phormii]|uniref:Uncharacterized protein n=1 Tax=Colletotrichum phormii TaxID=359342 RepID=A0AAI9ZKV6_9PEZI|nr:uncharacterized protein BDP81DRAFT_433992 [Colletotrichum phormii]KAK1633546.1 hypothetical protein BDP81DRAFT_433992 [Colletotrichum phormii]